MGRTLVEKIFTEHTGHDARAGDIVVSPVDFVFSHDGNRAQPTQTFRELGGDRVFDPSRVALFLDHAPNVHTTAVSELHNEMRSFARDQGVWLYDIGRGISHQVLPEEGHAMPGRIVVGSDSHTCTAGAFGLLATGVGSTDLAVAMMLGKLWFKVPPTRRIVLAGEPQRGVYAKDIVLAVLGELGADGATYQAVEYTGRAVCAGADDHDEHGLRDGREVRSGRRRRHHPRPAHTSDDDAEFAAVHEIDVAALVPQVALPPRPDDVQPVSAVAGTPISQATIGTSANGQLEDLRAAAELLRGNRLAPGVRLFVAPASRNTYFDALRGGLVEEFVSAGAVWGTPGCSGCTGASAFGVPGDGENMITSAPRNFVGRTGNRNASICLTSPATVMAAAIAGEIVDPREVAA